MLDPQTETLMDDLVHPILAAKDRELKTMVNRAVEFVRKARVTGPSLALLNYLGVSLDGHNDFARAIWTEMSRVVEQTDKPLQGELPSDLKHKFDSYLSVAVHKTRAAMSGLGQQ